MCFGPNRGRLVTYTNPRRWLPGFAPTEAKTALGGIVERYLYAFGPATTRDFAQWLAMPRTWATKLFDSLAGELEPIEIDGAPGPAWVNAGDTAAPSTVTRGVRLLPYFDAYQVGCHPRELLFPGPAKKRALPAQAGSFQVLLVDGVVAGVWHQRRSGRRIEVTVEPLGRLSAVQRRELDDQVVRVGEVLEGTASLTIGTVTVGGHA
jgi:hypothetical protein